VTGKLQLAFTGAVILDSESREAHDHILLSQIRDFPDLGDQILAFTSPNDRVAQLYSQALGSLFVTPYDSQGHGGDILTHLHTGTWLSVR
jgi:hypothetical protein